MVDDGADGWWVCSICSDPTKPHAPMRHPFRVPEDRPCPNEGMVRRTGKYGLEAMKADGLFEREAEKAKPRRPSDEMLAMLRRNKGIKPIQKVIEERPEVKPLDSTAATPVSSTYRYRDPEKHKAYMREKMRQRRQAEAKKRGKE